MDDNNTIGLGTTLEVNDGVADAFAFVDNLVNIGVPDPETGVIERKLLGLTQRTIRKKAALKDPGEFAFQYEYTPARKERFDALQDGEEYHWRFNVPPTDDAPSTHFIRVVPGFVKSNKLDQIVPDQIVTATCVVTVSGPAETDEDSSSGAVP